MKIFRTESGYIAQTDEGFHALTDIFGDQILGEQVAEPTVFRVPVEPSKVICVGLNYRAHAAEMNKTVPEEPLIFMKPTTALVAAGGVVTLPPQSFEVHHEGELAIVIGKRASKIDASSAGTHILGFTIANDVTARDIQRREKRYTRAKGFDTFCPLGPCIETEFTPEDHTVTLRINGEIRQQSALNDFIFDVPTVVSFISHVMTLLPGDIILTGTPAGVGPMQNGDSVEVEISGIGTLNHSVQQAPGR